MTSSAHISVVGPTMGLEAGVRSELLPARLTLKIALVCVQTPVLLHPNRVGEALVAHLAVIRVPALVLVHVAYQVITGAQRFAADQAWVG